MSATSSSKAAWQTAVGLWLLHLLLCPQKVPPWGRVSDLVCLEECEAWSCTLQELETLVLKNAHQPSLQQLAEAATILATPGAAASNAPEVRREAQCAVWCSASPWLKASEHRSFVSCVYFLLDGFACMTSITPVEVVSLRSWRFA